MAMTFEEAAARQYNRHTFYAVFLVDPVGNRTRVARTQRKSGTGLIRLLSCDAIRNRLLEIPGIQEVTYKKFADRLELSNGWKIEFGGTIRQEAE
jgi:hypothetical protein